MLQEYGTKISSVKVKVYTYVNKLVTIISDI